MKKVFDTPFTVEKIIDLIPDQKVRKLSSTTNVDYQVKKLYGRSVFYLLLYGILDSTKVSLRTLEDIFNSTKFRFLYNIDCSGTIKYNSISDRLATINPDYFKEIYQDIYDHFSKMYTPDEALLFSITRVDSTMVAEAANKLKDGMKVGRRTDKKQVKYTFQLTDLLPSSVEIFTQQSALSEDIAIVQTILKNIDQHKNNIIVFDRGVAKRQFYDDLEEKEKLFVTRVRETSKYELCSKNTVINQEVNNLQVKSDEFVYLFNKKNQKSGPFRLIKTLKKDGHQIWFLTNHKSISEKDVILIYQKRWDIEVFFRFIKQELNFSHLLSTNTNGIKVVLYITMILAILLLIYKKQNNLGYKRAVNRFRIELDELITKSIITICGGDPSLVFR